MRKKTFQAPMRVKETGEGQIECVFATVGGNRPDHDNDLTVKGAFGHQKNIHLEGWNHDTGLPVGVGEVFERGNDAVFKGKFFLNSQNARDHFETLKELPAVEFSYTFDIVDAERTSFNGRPGRILKKLTVWGVGPVTRGAGLGTRLLQLKSANGVSALSPSAFAAHIDQLLNAQLFKELNEVEQLVKSHTGKASGLDVHRRQLLAKGHAPAWVDAVIEGEILGLARQLEYEQPLRYAHDPNGAYREARRQLGAAGSVP